MHVHHVSWNEPLLPCRPAHDVGALQWLTCSFEIWTTGPKLKKIQSLTLRSLELSWTFGGPKCAQAVDHSDHYAAGVLDVQETQTLASRTRSSLKKVWFVFQMCSSESMVFELLFELLFWAQELSHLRHGAIQGNSWSVFGRWWGW